MTDKVTLTNVSTFVNDTSAVSTVNNNMAAITAAMDNTLSRDGTSPNTMSANLDMNSNQILNLPSPASMNSPARLVDVASNPTITVPPTGTSGAVVGLLNGNNTYSGTSTFTNTVTLPSQSVTTSEIANNAVGSSQLANNGVTNAAIRQGVARSVIGVTGNATANVADLQGTTRQVLAVNTAGTALAFAQPQGDQLLGTTTNDNASAGNVGEYVSASIAQGSAGALTTATPANMTTLTLTAGDWDVWFSANFQYGASANPILLEASISTVSATLNTNPGFISALSTTNVVPGGNFTTLNVCNRVLLTSTTTIYPVVEAFFSVNGVSIWGSIYARRVR